MRLIFATHSKATIRTFDEHRSNQRVQPFCTDSRNFVEKVSHLGKTTSSAERQTQMFDASPGSFFCCGFLLKYHQNENVFVPLLTFHKTVFISWKPKLLVQIGCWTRPIVQIMSFWTQVGGFQSKVGHVLALFQTQKTLLALLALSLAHGCFFEAQKKLFQKMGSS